MSILIAEDNIVSQKIIELNLRKHRYDTITVQTGKEALKVLLENPDIRLLITDVMMPELDGLTLLSKMKETPMLREIPVILCTALKDVDTVKRAIELGCKYYIVKPINPGQLQQKVREVLGHDKPILQNKRQVMNQLNLDSRAYIDIAKAFRTSVDEKIEFLENYFKKGTDDNIVTSLCELLESASLLGAVRVNRILESMAMKNDSGEEPVSHGEYQLFQRELIQLQAALPDSSGAVTKPYVSPKQASEKDAEKQKTTDTESDQLVEHESVFEDQDVSK